jgi:8-oxo-dGTP diphosphatase
MSNIICVGGFFRKKNKYLFGKRSKKKSWAPGAWDIIGGKALKNEHPMYALAREVKEETGVQVLNAELISTIKVFDEHDMAYFLYHIYIITHWKNKPQNCSKEHTKLKWFTRDDLDKLKLAMPEYLRLLDEQMSK